MVIGMTWLWQAVMSNLKSQSTTQLWGSASKTLLCYVLSQSVLHVLEFSLENTHIGRGPWADLQYVPSPSGGQSFKVPGEQNRHAHCSVCIDYPHLPRVAESAMGLTGHLLGAGRYIRSSCTLLSTHFFPEALFPLFHFLSPPLPSCPLLSGRVSLCSPDCLSLQVWSLWVCATMSGFRFCICFFGFLFL